MKKLLFVSLFFALIGCDSEDKAKNTLIKIDELSINNIDVEKFFGDVSFLSIDKNERMLPGASKIIYQNNHIYVSDGYVLYTYDMSGKMMSCIDKKGRANDEYLGIMDFDVLGDKIAVLDGHGRKVLFYNQQGVFQFDVGIDVFASTFVILNDSLLILNNDYSFRNNSQNTKLTLLNVHSKETSYFGEFNANKVNYMHILGGSNFYKNGDNLFFYEKYNPVVSTIENNAMVENLRIELPNMPQDDYYDQPFYDVAEFMTNFTENGHASGVSNFYCSENRILFKFIYKQKEYYCSYNRKTQKVDFMGELFLYDDVRISNIYFYEGQAVASISALRLIDAMGKNKRIADLVEKYGVTEDSSPLLIVIKNVEEMQHN